MGPRKKVSRPLTPLVLSNDQLGELSEWEEHLLAKLRLVKDVQEGKRPNPRAIPPRRPGAVNQQQQQQRPRQLAPAPPQQQPEGAVKLPSKLRLKLARQGGTAAAQGTGSLPTATESPHTGEGGAAPGPAPAPPPPPAAPTGAATAAGEAVRKRLAEQLRLRREREEAAEEERKRRASEGGAARGSEDGRGGGGGSGMAEGSMPGSGPDSGAEGEPSSPVPRARKALSSVAARRQPAAGTADAGGSPAPAGGGDEPQRKRPRMLALPSAPPAARQLPAAAMAKPKAVAPSAPPNAAPTPAGAPPSSDAAVPVVATAAAPQPAGAAAAAKDPYAIDYSGFESPDSD